MTVSPEDMYVEMCKELNCPHCGGSGHIDDVKLIEIERKPVAWYLDSLDEKLPKTVVLGEVRPDDRAPWKPLYE